MKKWEAFSTLVISAVCVLGPAKAFAGSGTEGASFLDIPVGAAPASLGSAYTALANDVYAPTINPGGLAFLQSTQFTGQHLSYINSNHYEYLSVVHPIEPSMGIGLSTQYIGTGDTTETDETGATIGDFSSHYAAYNLSFGKAFTDRLSLGVTGKWINAKIADVSANAYGADLGSMYKAKENLTLAATLTNIGSKLKFLNEGDSLPMAFHVAAAYRPEQHLTLASEGVYYKTGLLGGRFGAEWRPIEMLALRAGYKTETTKGLSPLSGLTTGLGINLWGQEFAYSWLPLGDLGDTHYVSFVIHLGEEAQQKRNLIKYQQIKSHRTAKTIKSEEDPEYEQFMELLTDAPSPRQARNTQGR